MSVPVCATVCLSVPVRLPSESVPVRLHVSVCRGCVANAHLRRGGIRIRRGLRRAERREHD
eukprot:48802-Eustigmatos_ZCMA.PRE.1